MHIKLKRAPGIYIAGFMGSGKSTVGRMLADRLGWQFADLDAEIEAQERQRIGHIFETRGEAEFRRLETAMIGAYVRHVERGAPTVIALGGGAFVHPGNFHLIEQHGISIWLDCSFEAIGQRLAADPQDRPLARDPAAFRKLYDDRQAGYSRADFRVEGDCAPAIAVEAILALPLWK
jgi:shikimate kinase